MAKIRSARKAHRASLRKSVFNARRKRAMKAAARAVSDAPQGGGAAFLPNAYAAIDKAAKRGILKKNTAARMKSRIAKRALVI